MTINLSNTKKCGNVQAPASKSVAQRLFFCAAFGKNPCEIHCPPLSADLTATLRCLNVLGASVSFSDDRVRIEPIHDVSPGDVSLFCGESGTTLRFLLPLVGILGLKADFVRSGRLPDRPLEPFLSELVRHGMTIEADGTVLHCEAFLHGGDWHLPGNISSQFISALLLALPLLSESSTLSVSEPVESAPYIHLTEQILCSASLCFAKDGLLYTIPGGQRADLSSPLYIEGDWSSAAPFLAMGALSDHGVSVSGLDCFSVQGDRIICEILRSFGADVFVCNDNVCAKRNSLHGITFDASQTPDLAPIIAALGALSEGETRIVNAARLRGKESDRLHSTAALLNSLGADVQELPDGLVIIGKHSLPGGETDSFSDHRVAMAAAVASCGCTGGVMLHHAECVEKSYPCFWDDLASLEGL